MALNPPTPLCLCLVLINAGLSLNSGWTRPTHKTFTKGGLTFVCPYCHSNLVLASDATTAMPSASDGDGYQCASCRIDYPYRNGVYHFYNPDAEHWRISWSEAKKSKTVGVPANFVPCQPGTPYTFLGRTKEEQADILPLRANALLFNIAFDLLHSYLTDENEGYILDIATYTGWSSYLLARYKTTIAFDISEKAIETIPADFGKGIIKVVGDGEYLPLPDESISAIFMNSGYHHMIDRLHALNEWWRVLKPGGCVIATGETPAYVEVITGNQALLDTGERGYTYKEMMEIFKQCKFEIIHRLPIRYSDLMEYKGIEEILPGDESLSGDNGIIFAVKGHVGEASEHFQFLKE